MKTTVALFLICLSGTVLAQTVTYPLHVGDRWQFWYINEDVTIVSDTLMSNGQTYFVLEHSLDFPAYQRVTGNQVYIYDTETSSDQLWYDFDLSPGDTVNVIDRPTDTTIVYFNYSVMDTIFGVERRQWHFSVDFALHVIDDEVDFVVTDSLGVTEFCRCGIIEPISLRGAVIYGVQYGNVTSVAEDHTRPSDFTLNQNYPNPFNPVTTISYQVPRSTYVTLKVSDILGREVATLVDGVQEAGGRTVAFDASNLASGIYIYRMTAGPFTATKRMLFLK